MEYRGKNTRNGLWVYGGLIEDNKGNKGIAELVILNNYVSAIVTQIHWDTACKNTWAFDKKAVPAFVGDVFEDEKGVRRQIMSTAGGFVTESNPISFGYGLQGGTNPTESLADQQTVSWFSSSCTIIGNIHDNPELLCSTVK